jgi:hypothetical protein
MPKTTNNANRPSVLEIRLGDTIVGTLKRAGQSKVVKMMVSSEGMKGAEVGTIDSAKQAQNAG